MPNQIKIPKIRQLPSGAWTCQLRIDGQSISITDDDYNIVMAKAYALKTGLIKSRKASKDLTVGTALLKHIRSLEPTRSPATIRGYYVIQRNYFKSLQDRPVSSLTTNIIQREINSESERLSPKTLKNAWTLISAAIEAADGDHFNAKLPQVPPAKKEYLTPEQISVLLTAIKGHPLEAPILLGLWSCRRSEIFALRWEDVDLDNRRIRISRAVVPNSEEKYVEKPMPKNKSSVRTIPMTDQLYEALVRIEPKSGRIYNEAPGRLYDALTKICTDNNLPQIGVHGLRHSFASLAYSLGLPTKVTQQIGGWQTDDVMMRIYTHISERDVNVAAAEMLEFFNSAEIKGE